MFNGLIPWLAAAFALLWAYPWARWLLAAASPGRRDPVLAALLTIGLSLGGLAWLLMLLAALSPALVTVWPVTALCLLLSGMGWALWRRVASHTPTAEPLHLSPAALTAVLLSALLIGLTLFNAAYWPFGEDDTLTLYAPMAYRFATSGQFGGAGLYDAYPQLNPLIMAYLHLASGGPQEYASRFAITVLALGAAGAAYALGRDLFRRETGITAAFLLLTTPILLHWASSAYTDIPAGTYYGLAALFAWRAFRDPHLFNALLAGLLAGLAAFTKNGALLVTGSLAGWIAYTWWLKWRRPDADGQAIGLRDGLLIAGGFLLAAGPWYGYALRATGYLVPPTGWTDQAVRSLLSLVGPAVTPGQYMAAGMLAVLGAGWQAIRLWRARPGLEPRAALLLGFGVPFWLVWWWLFSYDKRFLLMVWPVFSVMGAEVLLAAVAWLPGPHQLTRGPRWLAPLALLLISLPALRISVDHKPAILQDPFMDDRARHVQQLGGRWDAILWLRENAPEGTAVLCGDYKFAFALMQDPFTLTRLGRTDAETILRHDYWIATPDQAVPDWASSNELREVFATEDGFRIYAVGR